MGRAGDISPEGLEQLFKEAGWTAQRSGEADWEIPFRGDVRDWAFHVRLTEYWVYFYTAVLNKIKPECRANVYEQIGRLNFVVDLCKYSINEREGISLGVELPRENLTAASMISDALGALALTAEAHYLELVNLANERNPKSEI